MRALLILLGVLVSSSVMAAPCSIVRAGKRIIVPCPVPPVVRAQQVSSARPVAAASLNPGSANPDVAKCSGVMCKRLLQRQNDEAAAAAALGARK